MSGEKRKHRHVHVHIHHLANKFMFHILSFDVFQKLLYSPLGKIFILQPDEKTSPPHPLLPTESAFYELDSTICGYSSRVLSTFLNQPHPIETLSDPTAYGSEGTILRDHDSSNYLKAVNGILRQYSKARVLRIRKQRIDELWPSPYIWSHEKNNLMTKEITTGV